MNNVIAILLLKNFEAKWCFELCRSLGVVMSKIKKQQKCRVLSP